MNETTNDDLWGEALADQAKIEQAKSEPGAPLKESGALDLLSDIPVELSVEIGRTRLTISQILKLAQGSVVELDVLAGEPLNIYVNQVLIAQGEVVTVNDRFGIRLTDILSASERAKRMAKKR
jgi:flagellar motor switch protein FliN/FliY